MDNSYILEINPVTKEIVWKYKNGEQFHSCFTSSAQRLANGNAFINEAAGGRIFEVTVKGEIVWEYVYIKEFSSHTYKYPYNYCPQTEALERPKEMEVLPPQDMRIPPVEAPLE